MRAAQYYCLNFTVFLFQLLLLIFKVMRQQVKYDFDEIYDRVGTDSVRWDGALERHSSGLDVGMGIADMDFKAAPCIGEALAERCEHENWGYLVTPPDYVEAIVSWNQRRYGLDIDPSSLVLSTGVHPGIIAALKTSRQGVTNGN